MLIAGVKEAFLKLAQGVITLHQHNQLNGPVFDPSYSPLSSYTTQAMSASQLKENNHHGVQNHQPKLNVNSGSDSENSVLPSCCSS